MRAAVAGLWLALAAPMAGAAPDFRQATVELAGQTYRLEVADTPERRSLGLMFRSELPARRGMLFLYPKNGNYRIWMKNTRIPLTVLWLDEQARILHRALLTPCRQDPCPIEAAPRPSRFILELPASDRDRFRLGQQLKDLLRFRRGDAAGAATTPPADLPRSVAAPSD